MVAERVECQGVEKMRQLCVCVCVDRLMRSLESVPTMLGVPPLLHNRRFAQAPVNSSKDMESGNPGRTLGRR
jgi:hypothetical protein